MSKILDKQRALRDQQRAAMKAAVASANAIVSVTGKRGLKSKRGPKKRPTWPTPAKPAGRPYSEFVVWLGLR
jgi:hypothetical protein